MQTHRSLGWWQGAGCFEAGSFPGKGQTLVATHPLGSKTLALLCSAAAAPARRAHAQPCPSLPPQAPGRGCPLTVRCSPPRQLLPTLSAGECYNYQLPSKAAAPRKPGFGLGGRGSRWHHSSWAPSQRQSWCRGPSPRAPAGSGGCPGALPRAQDAPRQAVWLPSPGVPGRGNNTHHGSCAGCLQSRSWQPSRRGTAPQQAYGAPYHVSCVCSGQTGGGVGPGARRPHRGCWGPWPYTSILAGTPGRDSRAVGELPPAVCSVLVAGTELQFTINLLFELIVL